MLSAWASESTSAARRVNPHHCLHRLFCNIDRLNDFPYRLKYEVLFFDLLYSRCPCFDKELSSCDSNNCIRRSYGRIERLLCVLRSTSFQQAHNEYVMAEKKREEWELKNHREGEIFEMVQIFEVRPSILSLRVAHGHSSYDNSSNLSLETRESLALFSSLIIPMERVSCKL